jgi:hypothetical protein
MSQRFRVEDSRGFLHSGAYTMTETAIDAQVRKARRRITINRWFGQLCTTKMIAAGLFAVIVAIVRLYALDWPLGTIAMSLGGLSLIASLIWAVATRTDLPTAATALDKAAGLRERISSGLYCAGADDPFERAVLADAERTARHLTVRTHLRYDFPKRFASMSLVIVVAALALLLPNGLLNSTTTADEQQSEAVQRTTAVIKKQIRQVKSLAKTNPELAKLSEDLAKIAEGPDGRPDKPGKLRHTAIKKLDAMQDVLKQKRAGDDFRNTKEFKKMLRGLKPPQDKESSVSKLTQALAQGDFKAAREQIKELKSELDALSKTGDAKQTKALQKQLDTLAMKLEKLADNKKLKQQLQQLAGMKKEDIEKMLKNLTPEDIERVKKELESKGLSQTQIQQVAQKMKQQAGAKEMAQKMSEALKQAAAAASHGGGDEAAGGLSDAASQLSAMEMLEQEMSEIDSSIAGLQDMKNQLGNPGSGSQGGGNKPGSGGEGSGDKPGPGMGQKPGQGRGGIASEQQTSVSFAKHRQKVNSENGAIIGQYLINGPQVKGQVSPEVQEVITAADRDAADAVDRAQIPRRYHKAIRKYFSDLQGRVKKAQPSGGDDDEADEPKSTDEDHTEPPSEEP